MLINVINKLKCANMAMARCKNKFSIKTKLLIYSALALSHLNSGALIYGATSLNNMKQLEGLQNKIIRNLFCKKFNSHTAQLYKDNNLLKVTDIIEYNRAVFVNMFNNDEIPLTLHKYFKYSIDDPDNRGSRKLYNLNVPYTANQGAGFFPFPEIFKSWNKLPNGQKHKQKSKSFKKELKKYMINNYSTTCNKQKCYSCKQNRKYIV